MELNRREVIEWVASQVLPHEADIRRRLSRGLSFAQVDDVIQEAYARLAALPSVGHITSGRAYFYAVARNVITEQVRRARIVRIDSVAEIDALNVMEDEPSPERVVAGRRELDRVRAIIEGLPDKCRRIFILRRIEGVPQREIARQLGVTENVVEAQSIRGVKLIMKALADEGVEPPPAAKGKAHERDRQRSR